MNEWLQTARNYQQRVASAREEDLETVRVQWNKEVEQMYNSGYDKLIQATDTQVRGGGARVISMMFVFVICIVLTVFF